MEMKYIISYTLKWSYTVTEAVFKLEDKRKLWLNYRVVVVIRISAWKIFQSSFLSNPNADFVMPLNLFPNDGEFPRRFWVVYLL